MRMTLHACGKTAGVLALQVKDLGLCTVLMMDDSTFPVWLVLVPRQVSPHLATCYISQRERWLLTTAIAPRQG